MQSSKLPRKTSKSVENTVDSALPETPTKTSASRSAKLKPETAASVQSADTIAPKRHRATTQASPAAASSRIKETPAAAPQAAAVVSPAAPVLKTSQDPITDEMIASLAHSYWVERGHAHGSAEEDWHRAERHLRSKATHA